MMNQDTICAIATAQGGAIGSIRVSGADAIRITSHIFTPAKSGKTLADCKPYTLTFGKIHDGEEIIDEVLVSLFRAPHSYTGEDSTEITCHGAGAAFLCPGCDTVIDIGGQDSKVILLDPSGGQVKDFLMNDKCAAGTGRFLEMTMSRVGSDIASIDTFVEGAEPVTINSMCAVFAESEIIGLLAQETPPGSIALGCIYSICRRTAIFAQKLAPEHPKVFFSGGLAQSQVVREVLARYLGVESVTAHPLCQYNGAIGAAVLGWKRINR